MPEVNLSQQQAITKEELQTKVGLSSSDGTKPLMVQILESFLNNEKSNHHESGSFALNQKKMDKVEPIS